MECELLHEMQEKERLEDIASSIQVITPSIPNHTSILSINSILPETSSWMGTDWDKDLKWAIGNNYKYVLTVNDFCLYRIESRDKVTSLAVRAMKLKRTN